MTDSNHSDNSNNKTEQKLKGHSYDGIEELDNALPAWWLNGFYLTIMFALGYFSYYILGEGPTLVKEYEHTKGAFEYAQYTNKVPLKTATEEELKILVNDTSRVKAGQSLFQSKCVSCHGNQGQGGIGPNLTDNHWIHGGKLTQILATVTNGVSDKGMPPWGALLKQDELHSLVAFVRSIRGSNPPNAKAPQGELEKE